MKLKELVKNLPLLEKRNWNPSLEIRGIVSDSRRLKQGDLFVACPGPQRDGSLFLEEAFQKGAPAAVSEKAPPPRLSDRGIFLQVPNAREALAMLLNRFYDSPSEKLNLIGITGTNGKTTVASLLTYLLKGQGPVASIGTLGLQTSSGRTPLSNTTPGAEELFLRLAELAREGVRYAALEVSSHALDQRRVLGLHFELALFTQLTPEHLDYHPSMEHYFQAKRLLFHQAPKPRRMLVNQDSPYGRRLLQECPKAHSFGFAASCDYQALDVTTSLKGSEFVFKGPREKWRVKTSLPLTHNVSNVLAALATLDLLGLQARLFQEALESFPGVSGRMERMEGEGFSVFIDYAHTPDAFERLLSEARRLAPGRILTVFGCGGDRDPFKRPEMTRIAYHYSDGVILTSDNPRTEDPAQILSEMRKGLPGGLLPPNVLEISDRREAIEQVLALARPGDVVLILGKGHEDYQVLGTRKIHFDDREAVRHYLQRRSRKRIRVRV